MCDNQGVIYLAKNHESKRTKHIGVRYHFVRQYIEDGIIIIEYVTSEENISDIFTKNNNSEVYQKHSNNIVNKH